MDPHDDATHVGHITSLHILPQLRGQGYGRVLMDHVLAEFRRRGFAEVTLLQENWKARRFYERRGFRNDGATQDVPRGKRPGGAIPSAIDVLICLR